MYSNLIHSQDVNEDAEQNADNKDMADVAISYMRPVSSGLSEAGRTSSRSLSRSFSNTALDNANALSRETSKNLPEVSFYRVAHLNKPETPVLILGTIVSIITGSIMPIFGLLTSFMITTFYELPHKLKKDSEFWALMFVVLGLVAIVLYPSKSYLFSVAGSRLIERIRLMCFEKVVNMEIGWFDMPDNSSGMIGSRLSTDAALIRALVGDALAEHVREVSSVVVALVIAFQASWQLALIILAILPLLGFNGYLQVKSTKGFSRDAKVSFYTQYISAYKKR